MNLYHVSFDRVERFTPKVPENYSYGEDDQTPRICLSDSVVRCINARPGQAWPIYYAKKAGIPVGFYVYQFHITDAPNAALLFPAEVAERGVRDAVYWHEYWLLEAPTAVTETFLEVRGITYQRGCAPAKWAHTLDLCETEDQAIHFAEKFARYTSKKLQEKITTDLLYEEFYKELRQLWDTLQNKKITIKQ